MTRFSCAVIGLVFAACGGGGRLSSYTAVNAACVQQEEHIAQRTGTSIVTDQDDLEALRRACDQLLSVVEHSQ